MNTDYEKLESNIGYCFKDKDLLINALTHTSYANEHKHKGMKDNERLEFLGDAVLELLSSEYLYKNMKDMPEGKMTKLRASPVSYTHLDVYKRQVLCRCLQSRRGDCGRRAVYPLRCDARR